MVLLGGSRAFKQEGLVGRHRWTDGSEWEGVSSKGTVGLSTPPHFLLFIDHRVSGLVAVDSYHNMYSPHDLKALCQLPNGLASQKLSLR